MASANAKSYAHVLLISVDGLHAVDLANYVVAHQQSTMASLQKTGVFYPNALTTNPSDSFPGLVAQVTGGTPAVTGVYYDDSFDRSYFAADSKCQGTLGTEVNFAESIDIDDTRLDGGGTPGKPMAQIDPAKLPRVLVNAECKPVFPHDFVRVNNIFEIVCQHGGRTAWSDKHPAYEWLNGPSGVGVDDFYALEQDSLILGTKVKTTGSFKAEREFDEAHVKAVINEMKGLDSTGADKRPVRRITGWQRNSIMSIMPWGNWSAHCTTINSTTRHSLLLRQNVASRRSIRRSSSLATKILTRKCRAMRFTLPTMHP